MAEHRISRWLSTTLIVHISQVTKDAIAKAWKKNQHEENVVNANLNG